MSDDYVYLYGSAEDVVGSKVGSAFFRPASFTSLYLDFLVWGENPLGYHLTNLILHILTSIGVGLTAGRIIRWNYSQLLAGLLFTIHPVHPEAVSWIAGRFDLLAGCLVTWAFFTYLDSNEKPGKRLILKIASFLLFLFACLAKEMAFVFPLVLIAYELIFSGNQSDRRTSLTKLLPVIPYFLISTAVFIYRYLHLGGLGGYSGLESPSAASILFTIFIQPFIWLIYPLNRVLYGEIGVVTNTLLFVILISPLVLFYFKPSWRTVVFGAIATVLSVLPVAQIGYIDPQMQSSRFLYIPSIFFVLGMTSLFDYQKFLSTTSRKFIVILLGFYLLINLTCLNQNNFSWQDAGRVTRGAVKSTESLVNKYAGRWGTDFNRLLVYNVPDAHLGAYVFRAGFASMLRGKYEDELKDVTIEVVLEEISSFENISILKGSWDEGTVAWFFNDIQSRFEEITQDDRLEVKKSP